MIIKKLIEWKQMKPWYVKIPVGICLYILNLLLALDFMVSAFIGVDPRLSISALIGIRLTRNPQHVILGKLPSAVQNYFLEAASWWNYTYPPINRSIWT